MNLEECKEKVKNFLDDNCPNTNLKNQLEWLKTYNFAKLAAEEGVHEDSTTIVKEIYFITWHNKLPMLTNWEDMEKNYGGETINTFNTLFQEDLEGVKLFVSEDDTEFYKKVRNFRSNYLTIGNFMLLPLGKANGSTLNTKKGSYSFKYKDYSDLFLFDLFETSNLNDLKEVNNFYFDNLTKEEFFKVNFLTDYYEQGHAKIVFPHFYDESDKIYYPMYWWKKYKNPKEHCDEYKKFAISYIDKANEIIKNRAESITRELLSSL